MGNKWLPILGDDPKQAKCILRVIVVAMMNRGTIPHSLAEVDGDGIPIIQDDFCDKLHTMTEEDCNQNPVLSAMEKVWTHYWSWDVESDPGKYRLPGGNTGSTREAIPLGEPAYSVQGRGEGLKHVSLPDVPIQVLLLLIRDGLMKNQNGNLDYSLLCSAGVNARGLKITSIEAPLKAYFDGNVPVAEETISGLITSAGTKGQNNSEDAPNEQHVPMLYGTVTDLPSDQTNHNINSQHASRLDVGNLKTFFEAIVST